MTITFTREEKEKIVKEVFQNFPEYAVHSFYCTFYDYDNFVYKFTDMETDIEYQPTLEQAVKGFELFANQILNEKLFFDGLGSPQNLLEGENYDAYSLDGLLQCILLGEVVYG